MCNDLQKKLDEIRAASPLHQMDNTKAIRSINNVIKKDDESFRKNVSLGKTGKKRPDMVGNKNPAHLDHVREGKINRLKGVKKSKEQVEKYKASMKLKPDIICPYCGFVSRNQGNMNRYHLNKYCQKKFN
jgi:hypothetical protein